MDWFVATEFQKVRVVLVGKLPSYGLGEIMRIRRIKERKRHQKDKAAERQQKRKKKKKKKLKKKIAGIRKKLVTLECRWPAQNLWWPSSVILCSRRSICWLWNVTLCELRGRCSIWWCWTVPCLEEVAQNAFLRLSLSTKYFASQNDDQCDGARWSDGEFIDNASEVSSTGVLQWCGFSMTDNGL